MRQFQAPSGSSGFSIGGQQYDIVNGVIVVEDDCTQVAVLYSLGCVEVLPAPVGAPDTVEPLVAVVVAPEGKPDIKAVPDVVVPAPDKA